MLQKLIFGWVKFTKTSRYVPAFKYPEPSSDGTYRALKVLSTGYTANNSYEFYEFKEKILQKNKGKTQLADLKKMNGKYNFSFE